MTGPDKDAPLLALSFEARAANLKTMRAALSACLDKTACGEQTRRDIVLATDEACQNIIRHAYGGDSDGLITLEVHRDGRRLSFLVRDFAAPVNVDKIRPRALDELRPGGLGTHFMRELMDEVEIQPLKDGIGNLLRMTKNLD